MMSLLRGRIVSGMGNFSYWIEKLQGHYFRKTGMKLFPGTLNIQLEKPYTVPKRRLRLEGREYGGTVSVNIVPCSIFGRKAFLLRTDANEEDDGDHPKTIVEIATDLRLRDHFHLKDGDLVEVEVPEGAKGEGTDAFDDQLTANGPASFRLSFPYTALPCGQGAGWKTSHERWGLASELSIGSPGRVQNWGKVFLNLGLLPPVQKTMSKHDTPVDVPFVTPRASS